MNQFTSLDCFMLFNLSDSIKKRYCAFLFAVSREIHRVTIIPLTSKSILLILHHEKTTLQEILTCPIYYSSETARANTR